MVLGPKIIGPAIQFGIVTESVAFGVATPFIVFVDPVVDISMSSIFKILLLPVLLIALFRRNIVVFVEFRVVVRMVATLRFRLIWRGFARVAKSVLPLIRSKYR